MDVLAAITGIEMLGYPFMQRAYLAAICIAVIGPLVRSFLVHREMAMIVVPVAAASGARGFKQSLVVAVVVYTAVKVRNRIGVHHTDGAATPPVSSTDAVAPDELDTGDSAER